MLSLSRNIYQSLYIGDDVKIIILGFDGDHVRIGIDAPKEIPVHRKEVYDKIQLEDEIWKNH